MTLEFFDSHAHLESSRFDTDREAVIAHAFEAGVIDIITCGSDLETSIQNVVLARRHPGIQAAVGIHGHCASSAISSSARSSSCLSLNEPLFAEIMALAQEPDVCAIGEIGLDYHYDFSPRDVQRAVLARQLDIASQLDLPVILHNRESDEDLRTVVDGCQGPLRGVLHCFLADQEMADWAIQRGFYVGVGGPLTFGSVRHLADIVRRAPRERLLIETDCPYLAPHPKRGKRNEPSFVLHVAQRLAEVLDMNCAGVAHLTTENARRLFGVN